ncbi:structural maintenance of chromosomes protein 1 [Artemisia annua]|uniref:Structural maintenance of chromosomes protein 1 n=1 Tax=Artemisia annua TaxID=35608 RepID=A0A2U1M786_ARTAN|nr:structural maintenance of chromosomes protein 1 [Artemisia annua]
MRPAEREKVEAYFKQKIGSVISEVGRTSPDLKAVYHYVALEEKERKASKNCEDARDEVNIKVIVDLVIIVFGEEVEDVCQVVQGNDDSAATFIEDNAHPKGNTESLNQLVKSEDETNHLVENKEGIDSTDHTDYDDVAKPVSRSST